MDDLPHIAVVDTPTKFNNVVYEEDEALKKNKVLAYLNQIGFISYNDNKQCPNGHAMSLRKVKKTDGWWWRCSPKNCQKTKSIRAGTFFFESKIHLWEVLLLIFNFAFEFLNTTTRNLVGTVSTHTIGNYKRRLRLIILTMFNKKNIKLGGEGRIVEIDESLFIKVKHNRGRDMLREKVWVLGLYERASIDMPKRLLFFKVEARDAVTLLNIIYNHVLPGTKISYFYS